LSSFVDAGLVDELIDHGTAERPHDALVHSYHAFADESSGQGKDASTLGICHRDAHGRVIQDLLRVFRPPFSPSAVIEQKAKLLRQFRLARVTGDGWATGLVADLYRANGIRYEQTARPKSVIYLDFLGLLSSRQVLMLDQPQQRLELLGLERRTAWGGRDTINHPTLK